MRTFHEEKFIKFVTPYDDGNRLSEVVADFDIDTPAELPAAENGIVECEGRILHQGSVCHIISAGVLCKLGGDGRWYDIRGEIYG